MLEISISISAECRQSSSLLGIGDSNQLRWFVSQSLVVQLFIMAERWLFPSLLVTSLSQSAASCILVLGRSMPVLVVNILVLVMPPAVDISLSLIAILSLPVDISHVGANIHVLGGDIPIIARDLHGLHGVAAHLPPRSVGSSPLLIASWSQPVVLATVTHDHHSTSWLGCRALDHEVCQRPKTPTNTDQHRPTTFFCQHKSAISFYIFLS